MNAQRRAHDHRSRLQRLLLTRRKASARLGAQSTRRRIAVLLLITWFPMCVLSLAQGSAIASTPRGSFLLDFATYARFFIAAPLLIIAEAVIRPRIEKATRWFADEGFIRSEDQPALERAIQRLTRRSVSGWATAVLVALALFGAWNFTIEHIGGVDASSWQSVTIGGGALRRSLPGAWNHLVAEPVVLFLFYRWLWRLLVWTLFLGSIARLDLQLIPPHADGAGGLGFLQSTHTAFGILAFAVSSVLSAEVAFRVLYEGAQLTAFGGPLLVFLLIVEVLFLGPLLVFTPLMVRARLQGLRVYGELVSRYDREFQRKWIDGGASSNAPLLGSSDIRSLADMGNSFQFVMRMRITPFGRGAVTRLLIATALPALPLLLLVIPISQILGALSKLVL